MSPRRPPVGTAFTAAVLAGGRSSRFGRDKARAPYFGRPLLGRVLASLADADERLIVGERRYPQFARAHDARQVGDIIASGGPLSGLHAALTRARHPWVAVAACDLPHLTPDYWRVLLARAGSCDAVMVQGGAGRLEPLAAVYHRDVARLAEARLRAGDYALHDLARALRLQVVSARVLGVRVGPRTLLNLNRPSDVGPSRPPRD